jgi:hypothetical protein
MNKLTHSTKGNVFRPSLPRGAGRPIFNLVLFSFILAVLFMAIGSVYAQPLDTSPVATTAPAIDPSAAVSFLTPLLQGLAGKYGWLPTVILAIGSLRVLCKPIMTVIENVVANDPVKAQKLANFEHGPIFKWVAFALDMGASIKLPVIKAAAPTA